MLPTLFSYVLAFGAGAFFAIGFVDLGLGNGWKVALNHFSFSAFLAIVAAAMVLL